MAEGVFGPNPVRATVGADGTATVSFQVQTGDAIVTGISVQVSTAVLESVATLYRNSIAATNRIDGTQAGSSGDATFDRIPLIRGQLLIVQWTGADVGATATATFSGTIDVQGGFRAI